MRYSDIAILQNQITNVDNLPNETILEQNAGRSVAEMVRMNTYFSSFGDWK